MLYHTAHQETTTLLQPCPLTPEEIMDQVESASRAVSLRPPHLGPPLKLHGIHVCLAALQTLLDGFSSQLEVWRTIRTGGLTHFDPLNVSDQAVYNAIEAGASHMQELFRQVSCSLRSEHRCWQDRCLAPFATQVLALDESTLDLMSRWLEDLHDLPRSSKALLAGRLSALFDVRLQQWVRIDLLDEAVVDSRDHALSMISTLQQGCLLLFDLGYLSFEWFDTLAKRGIWWVSRMKANVTFQVEHTWYHIDDVCDQIVFLGIYRSDQSRYPVRLIEVKVAGHIRRYLTNVLDPTLLSVSDVVKLYQRRWEIEMAFRLVKDYLGASHFWSAKWSSILTQIWAVLLLAQILHATQETIALKAGRERDEVSIELLLRHLPHLLRKGEDPIAFMVQHGEALGILRPSTRKKVEVPFVDPSWITPAPLEACQPRAKPARHSPQRKKPHKYTKTGACASVCIPLP